MSPSLLVRGVALGHRILLMPAVAGVAMLAVLVVTTLAGARNAALLARTENEIFPALETSRDLEERLLSIQHGLQDAVGAADLGKLGELDTLRDSFLERVGKSRANPGVDPRETANLETAFRAYFALARSVSQRMIQEDTGPTLVESLEEMTRKYNELRLSLEASTQRTRRDWETAAAAARRAASQSFLVVAAATLLCFGALSALSIARERDLNRRVEEAIANVQVLSGLLPICAWCKKIRDDQGYWSQIEMYIGAHSDAEFSHGICPDCMIQVRAAGPT